MDEIRYITTRVLENSSGQNKGRIRVLVLRGETDASVEYTCPECGFNENKRQVWVRPFNVKCGKCSYLIRVSSMKAEIKRMRKKNKIAS